MKKSEKFPFELTEIYKKAMDFTRLCRKICSSLPKGLYSDADQLRRASLSVCNNYTEGYGRWGKKDKKHFYTIAKGSAFECIPIVTLLHEEKYVSVKQIETIREYVMEVTKMLSGMINSLEKR